MRSKPSRKHKILFFLSLSSLFILGFAASSSYGVGTLTSYLAMVGAIFVALTISYIMLKLLFKSDVNSEGDELKFDELAADQDEISNKY